MNVTIRVIKMMLYVISNNYAANLGYCDCTCKLCNITLTNRHLSAKSQTPKLIYWLIGHTDFLCLCDEIYCICTHIHSLFKQNFDDMIYSRSKSTYHGESNRAGSKREMAGR